MPRSKKVTRPASKRKSQSDLQLESLRRRLQEERVISASLQLKVQDLHDKLYREREDHLVTHQQTARLLEGFAALREMGAADADVLQRLQERITRLEGYIERVREIDALRHDVEAQL